MNSASLPPEDWSSIARSQEKEMLFGGAQCKTDAHRYGTTERFTGWIEKPKSVFGGDRLKDSAIWTRMKSRAYPKTS
jgi:hypothetical protein